MSYSITTLNRVLESVYDLGSMYDDRMCKYIYLRDISHANFASIRLILEQARKRTKSAMLELYEMRCAVLLYLLRIGCQWHALPSDRPKERTVHAYFANWSQVHPQEVRPIGAGSKKSVWRHP